MYLLKRLIRGVNHHFFIAFSFFQLACFVLGQVIRRLVKNAKTGEIIKTEIVRIDSNGETTVTSYPAGTPVPSLASLQSGGAYICHSDEPCFTMEMVYCNELHLFSYVHSQETPLTGRTSTPPVYVT